MTPAIDRLNSLKVSYKIHEYHHDPASEAYGPEAAEKLGVPEIQVFKTLVVSLDGNHLLVAVLPVSSMLSMKRIAKAAGAKKAKMADPLAVQRSTGYVLGGVSPLGQKKRLKTIVDSSAQDHASIFISAGRRGLQIELSPEDVITATNGSLASISQ